MSVAVSHRLESSLQDAERRTLAQIRMGAPLPHILEDLLRAVESVGQGEMMASILLLDADGERLLHGAAPSLPKAYNEAIDGIAIGPGVGSCGTAAYLGHPVYVTDIATDPLWADFAELALSHGLRACWSTPIFGTDGKMLGTFAIYHPTPRSPTQAELAGINAISSAVAAAIERARGRPTQH